MMLMSLCTVLAFASGTATTAASGVCAITHVTLLAGDGSEATDATVLWRNGVITYIGQGEPPAGAEIINAAGKVLTPGFIESRSVLGLDEIGAESSTRDADAGTAWAMQAFTPADGFNPASVHIPPCRTGGITHAITGPTGHVLSGLAHWVTLAQQPTVDRQAAAALWGGVDKSATPHVGGSRGHLWLHLRQALEDAWFFASHGPAWERNQLRPLSLEAAHLRALWQTVQDGTPWVLTAHRASDISAAVTFAQREGISLVIAGGAQAWQVASMLAQAQVPVIVTPTQQQPHSFDALGARPDAAAMLHRAGVRVILSTDGSLMHMPWLRQQAGIAVAYGMERTAALDAITRHPATVFKKFDTIGSLAKGKQATMVLWSGDPFELSSVAERVWVAGEVPSRDSRQRRLFDRYHGRGRP